MYVGFDRCVAGPGRQICAAAMTLAVGYFMLALCAVGMLCSAAYKCRMPPLFRVWQLCLIIAGSLLRVFSVFFLFGFFMTSHECSRQVLLFATVTSQPLSGACGIYSVSVPPMFAWACLVQVKIVTILQFWEIFGSRSKHSVSKYDALVAGGASQAQLQEHLLDERHRRATLSSRLCLGTFIFMMGSACVQSFLDYETFIFYDDNQKKRFIDANAAQFGVRSFTEACIVFGFIMILVWIQRSSQLASISGRVRLWRTKSSFVSLYCYLCFLVRFFAILVSIIPGPSQSKAFNALLFFFDVGYWIFLSVVELLPAVLILIFMTKDHRAHLFTRHARGAARMGGRVDQQHNLPPTLGSNGTSRSSNASWRSAFSRHLQIFGNALQSPMTLNRSARSKREARDTELFDFNSLDEPLLSSDALALKYDDDNDLP